MNIDDAAILLLKSPTQADTVRNFPTKKKKRIESLANNGNLHCTCRCGFNIVQAAAAAQKK